MLSQNQTFEMKLQDFFSPIENIGIRGHIYVCVFVLNVSWNLMLPGHCVISAVYRFPPVQNMVDFSG